MDKKYGVYICEGCGIGEALDIEKLCDVPKEEGLAVKTCPILCGKEGVEQLAAGRHSTKATDQFVVRDVERLAVSVLEAQRPAYGLGDEVEVVGVDREALFVLFPRAGDHAEAEHRVSSVMDSPAAGSSR